MVLELVSWKAPGREDLYLRSPLKEVYHLSMFKKRISFAFFRCFPSLVYPVSYFTEGVRGIAFFFPFPLSFKFDIFIFFPTFFFFTRRPCCFPHFSCSGRLVNRRHGRYQPLSFFYANRPYGFFSPFLRSIRPFLRDVIDHVWWRPNNLYLCFLFLAPLQLFESFPPPILRLFRCYPLNREARDFHL